MKTALICGVNGQDGAYLAGFLLARGNAVFDTSRDAQAGRQDNLATPGMRQQVGVESMPLNDFRSVLQVLAQVRPEDVCNLARQSSARLSFEQPVETRESISIDALNLLDGTRFFDPAIRLHSAGSSESS